jgi:hypothetical protein
VSRQSIPKLLAAEMWRRHHADLLTVVSGIGLWLADHARQLRALFAANTADHAEATISAPSYFLVLLLLLYLVYIARDSFATVAALRGVVEIPYSMVTDKPVDEAEIIFGNHAQFLKSQHVKLDRIFERFLIVGSDWHYFHQQRIADDCWHALVRDIRAHFIRLSKRITATARYHIFFVTPPAVALGLGAVLGRDIRAIAYQYFGPGTYVPVFDPEREFPAESYHGHHRPQTTFSEIDATEIVESNLLSADVGIVLEFVSLPQDPGPILAVGAFSRVISVTHATHRAHLPASCNWTKTAAEVASLILNEISQGSRIHVFVGLPTALAFGLGLFLGDHHPIAVYDYDKENANHTFVFHLNELG